MSLLPAHRHQPLFPDLADWLTGLSTLENIRPFIEGRSIRVEDESVDGKYLLRAELPGLDPDKDVEITVHDGTLTIKAERSERQETKGHTEFSYGSFTRTITLPTGANEDDIAATYDKGILTVTVPLAATRTPQPKQITIRTGE
ncbi:MULTISPECIES: Hsp20/alpha crystallin family protein [Nocardia]|uniref:Hsp20/alpha crystallin family protein n=1 Tax=Nocardia TaxID=1817 RepID=UPI000D6987DE|nr:MULTISPECIES: Hsp20/alpha crystallin family protein [Nocardia]